MNSLSRAPGNRPVWPTPLCYRGLSFRGDNYRKFFPYDRAEPFSYLPVCFDFESKRVSDVRGNQSSGKGGRNQLIHLKFGKVYQVVDIIEPYIGKAFRIKPAGRNAGLVQHLQREGLNIPQGGQSRRAGFHPVIPEMACQSFGHYAPARISVAKEKHSCRRLICQRRIMIHSPVSAWTRTKPQQAPATGSTGSKPRVRPADPVQRTCPGPLFWENT